MLAFWSLCLGLHPLCFVNPPVFLFQLRPGWRGGTALSLLLFGSWSCTDGSSLLCVMDVDGGDERAKSGFKSERKTNYKLGWKYCDFNQPSNLLVAHFEQTRRRGSVTKPVLKPAIHKQRSPRPKHKRCCWWKKQSPEQWTGAMRSNELPSCLFIGVIRVLWAQWFFYMAL